MACILAALLACGAAEDPSHGRFLIVDTDAPIARTDSTPESADPLGGAIFSFDPSTRETTLFAQDPAFVDPQAIVRHRDGSWWVLDFAAKPIDPASDTASRGAVFRLSADGATLRRHDSSLFRAPTSLLLIDERTLLISDRAALPGEARRGAVFRLDLDSGETEVLVAADSFRAPSWLAADPNGRVLLLDADAKTSKDATDEGIVFVLDLDARTATTLLALERGVSPLGFLPLNVDDLLIFDTNADPRNLGGPLGALFRARRSDDARDWRIDLVASIPRFRDPVRGCLGPDGRVWFVDANADPEKRGPDVAGRGQNLTGPGAIFTLDPSSGAVELVASPISFVNPVAIAWDPR